MWFFILETRSLSLEPYSQPCWARVQPANNKKDFDELPEQMKEVRADSARVNRAPRHISA